MQPPQAGADFVATFSRQRQVLLHRVGNALVPVSKESDEELPERDAQLTQFLMTSLEELKVCEEELLEQNRELTELRAQSERQVAHCRGLFEMAPCALMLTTTRGVIRETNRALALLATRDTYHLEGKPVAALVPKDARAEFRAQLDRIGAAGGVTDWRFSLERQTRAPIEVVATVQVIPSALTDTLALYWSLREA